MILTLSQLRTRTKTRADLTGSDSISDSEIDVYINQAIDKLINLVNSTDSRQWTESVQFTLAAGDDGYIIPSRVGQISGIDYLFDSSTSVNVPQFNFRERNKYQNQASYGSIYSNNFHYCLVGNKIKVLPVPSASATFELWYTPNQPYLTLATDTFDFKQGWDIFVILDAAMACLQQQQDPEASVLAREVQKAEERIIINCYQRDQGDSPTVIDVDNDGWF